MDFESVGSIARASGLPGFVAGAVRGGETALAAFGTANAETGAPMAEDTVFRIYSMTKAVTTAAVMQLVEQGRVDLDAPAARYASGLADVQVLEGFTGDGAPKLRAPKRAPTVRDLLLHTSGLGYTLWNADLGRYFGWAMGQGKAVNPMLDLPLAFDPGEAWEYGIGIDWAGRVVEDVSGQGLDEYFEANIFQPLAMADTGFWATGTMEDRLADTWFAGEDGGFVRAPRAPAAKPDVMSGGGGLLSTAPDYLRFIEAMAGDGSTATGRILKSETVAQMAACDDSAPRVRRLPTAMPAMTRDLDLWGQTEMRWTLGFMSNPGAGEHGRPAGSLAWAGLANTYYWIDRQNRLGGVLMTQVMPFAEPKVLAVFNALERSVYGG